MVVPYLFLLLSPVLMAAAQLLLKSGVQKLDLSLSIQVVAISVMTSPAIIAGLFIYVLNTFIWIYVLSKINVTVAYPVQTLAIVFVMIISYFHYHEQIPLTRWLGAIVIVIGVILASRP